ncbi:PilN domain-containing protein [uncultured Desulfuromonas sp.]|uniref:PilN domain-containing protein n=1 Tax=uncultured Desulfuromonas sp. TaxID=181013 RepID=UPI002AAAA79B|nr:PilN domain-containing protein [uncultured Desulfuromonas sp.]
MAFLPKTHVLLCCEHRLLLYQVQGQKIVFSQEWSLGDEGGFAAALLEVGQVSAQKSDEALIVGFPLNAFNFVHFTLPNAAQENLDEAVGYELMRHVAYDLSQAWYDYQLSEQGGSLRIDVMLALRLPLQQQLAAISAAGLTVTGMAPTLLVAAWLTGHNGLFVQGGDKTLECLTCRSGHVELAVSRDCANTSDSQLLQPLPQELSADDELCVLDENALTEKISQQMDRTLRVFALGVGDSVSSLKALPHRIDLVPPHVLRQRRLRLRLLIGAGLLFAVSLLVYPAAEWLGKQSALAGLDSQISEMRHQVEALSTLREQNQEMKDRVERLAAYVQGRTRPLDLLKEVTDVLTAETWLSAFEIHEQQLILRGTTADATAVLEALATSPLLQDVKFDSPVVKKGTLETFSIVATLK